MDIDSELRFIMDLNEKLADEVSFLRDEIRFLRELILKLSMEKNIPLRATLSAEEFNPIGGYVSVKNKIEDLERDSREKYNKDNPDASQE